MLLKGLVAYLQDIVVSFVVAAAIDAACGTRGVATEAFASVAILEDEIAHSAASRAVVQAPASGVRVVALPAADASKLVQPLSGAPHVVVSGIGDADAKGCPFCHRSFFDCD